MISAPCHTAEDHGILLAGVLLAVRGLEALFCNELLLTVRLDQRGKLGGALIWHPGCWPERCHRNLACLQCFLKSTWSCLRRSFRDLELGSPICPWHPALSPFSINLQGGHLSYGELEVIVAWIRTNKLRLKSKKKVALLIKKAMMWVLDLKLGLDGITIPLKEQVDRLEVFLYPQLSLHDWLAFVDKGLLPALAGASAETVSESVCIQWSIW